MLVTTWRGINMADGSQQETSVTEFYCKSVNLSLEELINIEVILFLTHNLNSKIPRNKSPFNLHYSSLGRLVKAASRKSLEIQAYSNTKPRTLLKRKFL